MASTKFRCPLCNSVLPKERWLEVTRLLREERNRLLAESNRRVQEAEKRGVEKERKRTAYLQGLLKSREEGLDRLRQQNQELREQLKQGTTPQMEGLLYEGELCRQLRKRFPTDKVTHHGRGGDVVQEVLLLKRNVGKLVFECKKVQRLSSKYVEQARRAQIQRQADYSILVTAASKANTFGFWTEKDVLVVHPAGVLALVSWLRDSLTKLAQARMTRQQREQAVKAILAFVDSPEFRSPLRDIIRRSEQLGQDLKKEIDSHRRTWLDRVAHYDAIWVAGHDLGRGLDDIMEQHSLRPVSGKLLLEPGREKPVYPLKKELLLLPGGKE